MRRALPSLARSGTVRQRRHPARDQHDAPGSPAPESPRTPSPSPRSVVVVTFKAPPYRPDDMSSCPLPRRAPGRRIRARRISSRATLAHHQLTLVLQFDLPVIAGCARHIRDARHYLPSPWRSTALHSSHVLHYADRHACTRPYRRSIRCVRRKLSSPPPPVKSGTRTFRLLAPSTLCC